MDAERILGRSSGLQYAPEREEAEMKNESGRPLSPRWAYWMCYLAIAFAFLPYAVALDRYPVPGPDQCFFNYPAVSYLEGTGFVYQVRDDAPNGSRLWAYHFPFFPHLQILVFRAFGVSQWSCRISEFFAANLAILILCRTLLSHGLPRSAVLLAIAWFGDRSLRGVLNGRMEGLYLLCLACGFWALCRRSTPVRDVFAGGSLAAAFGFHPVTVFFPIASGLWVLFREGRASLLRYLAGATVPALVFLGFWLPDLRGSVEQFIWHAGLFDHHNVVEKWAEVLLDPPSPRSDSLGWSRFWVNGLLITTVVLGARLAVRTFRFGFPSSHPGMPSIASLGTVFACCGFAGLLFVIRVPFSPTTWSC